MYVLRAESRPPSRDYFCDSQGRQSMVLLSFMEWHKRIYLWHPPQRFIASGTMASTEWTSAGPPKVVTTSKRWFALHVVA